MAQEFRRETRLGTGRDGLDADVMGVDGLESIESKIGEGFLVGHGPNGVRL